MMLRPFVPASMRALAFMLLLSAGALGADGGHPGLTGFTEAERAAIVRHGPWPMPWKPDPSNRVSGNPAAARLGFRLFFDARLSEGAVMSCATCHRPEHGFAEALSLIHISEPTRLVHSSRMPSSA